MVFTKKQVICIFEDGSKIHANDPCYKFDLTALLKKYFVFDERFTLSQQSSSPNEMLQSQLCFYDRALQELVDNCSSYLNEKRVQKGLKPADLQYLFLTSGE